MPRFAKIVKDGKTLMEFHGPENALNSGNFLSEGIYFLSEIIIRGIMPEKRIGCLGGEFGYAVDFVNDVFTLHPDYQDAECTCELAKEFFALHDHSPECELMLPNFLHKKSGLKVYWYKWIGRDMKVYDNNVLLETISIKRLHDIIKECFLSLPKEAIDEAQRQIEYENTEEYKKEDEEKMKVLFAAISSCIKDNDIIPL